MPIEQLQLLILFILAISAGGVIAYFIHRRRFRLPFHLIMLLALFIAYSIVKFFESDAIAVLFTWFSAIMAVSVTFSILDLLGRELNEKLALSLMLIVTSGSGALTNIYLFSTPISPCFKAFSLVVLIAIHIPFMVALIAYFRGKRKLSKGIQDFYIGKNSVSE
ncbi:MAG: hypothetical protein QW056_02060 [Candidatus Bathyarchaeia archaeon]